MTIELVAMRIAMQESTVVMHNLMLCRLPFSFINKDVAKATCLCMLEEASHSLMVCEMEMCIGMGNVDAKFLSDIYYRMASRVLRLRKL